MKFVVLCVLLLIVGASSGRRRGGNEKSQLARPGPTSDAAAAMTSPSKKKRHRCGRKSRKSGAGKGCRRRNKHRKLIKSYHENLKEVVDNSTEVPPHQPTFPSFFYPGSRPVRPDAESSPSGGDGGDGCSTSKVPSFMRYLYDSGRLRDGNTVRSLFPCPADEKDDEEALAGRRRVDARRARPIAITDDSGGSSHVTWVFAFNASKVPTFERLSKTELRLQRPCGDDQDDDVTQVRGAGRLTAAAAVYERIERESSRIVYRNVSDVVLMTAWDDVMGGDVIKFRDLVGVARSHASYLVVVRIVTGNDGDKDDDVTIAPRFVVAEEESRSRRDLGRSDVTFPILVIYGHDARSVVPMSDRRVALGSGGGAEILAAKSSKSSSSHRRRRKHHRHRRSIERLRRSDGSGRRNGGVSRNGYGDSHVLLSTTRDDVNSTPTSSASSGDGLCKVRRQYVPFDKLGWDNWVVAPKGFEMGYCAGECVVNKVKMSNHAVIQWLTRLLNVSKSPIKPPCCVPDKMDSLSILSLRNNQVVLKTYPDMIVTSCSCR